MSAIDQLLRGDDPDKNAAADIIAAHTRTIAAQAEHIDALKSTLATREAHMALLISGIKGAAAGRTTPLEQVDPDGFPIGPRQYTLNELQEIARVNNQDSPVVKALRYAIDALLEHQRTITKLVTDRAKTIGREAREQFGFTFRQDQPSGMAWQCTLSPEDVAIIARWYFVAKGNGAVVRETSAPILAKLGILDEGRF